jgi:uncharacterized protein (TIGR03089 family)
VRPQTIPAALDARLAADPARPFITFYDDATGERVELSVATYANWVSKTASLLVDELDAERGDLVLVDLPTHWTGAVWLGAAWACGLCVTDEPERAGSAAVVVCGPGTVERYAALAADRPVVALSLRPLGGRFTDPLPAGVTDYGAVVLAQPDVFVAPDPPSAGDAALRDGSRTLTQGDLLAAAADGALIEAGDRLLTDVHPCSSEGVGLLASVLAVGGSLVWVAAPDADVWERHREDERVTTERRATQPRS